MAERITHRKEDFAKWYTDIIFHAKLADYAPVRGCMVLRPNGYALWEVVQKELDKRFKETGHRNAYFPLFIPQSYLQKEKEHVEGFAPECAVVTHGGGKQLEEPLIIRPTSETIILDMFSKWIQSYRDLPLLINQWCNVVRWELRTKPFLRTLEFLWQEGHTCHATEEEAMRETLKMHDIYRQFIEQVLAIPAIAGEHTVAEKFAGAEKTYPIELLMQDNRGLQAATSHYFGTRFSQAFNIRFQDKEGTSKFVHTTSWGLSTRIIGALIMSHSDDQGLVLPPKAAPIAIVIIPILRKGKDNSSVLEVVRKIEADLKKDFNCFVDDREEHSPGYKFNEWEVQGIPLRFEVGPRDIESGMAVLTRRDGQKTQASLTNIKESVESVLNDFQSVLYKNAKKRLEENTHLENDYKKFKERVESEGGHFQMHWCGSVDCQQKVKEETKATIRVIPFNQIKENGKCIYCSQPSTGRVIFAKNY